MVNSLTIDEKQFLNRLEERVARVQIRHQVEISDFLEPSLQVLVEQYLHKQGQQHFLFCGGYEDAERQRLVLCPEYIDLHCAMADLALLKLQGKMDYVTVNHRDYLGAILSLGIKREKLGDLCVVEEGCYVLTSPAIADYIMMNELKVRGVHLHGEIVDLDQWEPPMPQMIPLVVMVSSMRIDTIVAHGFGISREKAMSFIQGGNVKVNHRVISENDHICQSGDIISFRGKGKIKIDSLEGETKKGKLKVKLLKYN